MALRCARAAKIFAMHTKPHSAKKPLRNAWNHASAIAMTLRTHDVFHRRCGCSAGEPVEKTLKCLTALKHAHAAKVLLASRGRQRLCTYAPLPRRHDGWRCILQCRRNAFLARTASRRLAKTFAARAQRNAISRLRYFSTGWPAEHPQRLWKKHGDDARCVRRVRRIVEGAGRRGQAATRAAGPGA